MKFDMQAENKVVSLETARKLKDAGWTTETEREWSAWSDHAASEHSDCHELHWELHDKEGGFMGERLPAPDATEIGELLPQIIEEDGIAYQLFVSVGLDKQWFIVYANEKDYHDNFRMPFVMNHNEAEARAAAFLWLKEQKLI